MNSSPVKMTSPLSNSEGVKVNNFLTMKDNYQRYQALAIKLHLQSEQCPLSIEEQNVFERQQAECLAGQAEVVKAATDYDVMSFECARLMMSLWTQEVVQGQDEKDLSDTDRMTAKIFEFFNRHLIDK